MELKKVIGDRRSIRYFLTHRPVEREKIQKMLEAARRASCVGNVGNPHCIVVWRDQVPEEIRNAISPPLGYQQMNTAPVFLLWFNDTLAYEPNKWVDDVKRLAQIGRIGVGDVDKTVKQVEKWLRPAFLADWKNQATLPLAFMDVGQAVANATLVAFEEGLGTCCMSIPPGAKEKVLVDFFKLPETAIPVMIQAVGYPAESREAGGQTPRLGFDWFFSEMEYGKPFPRDQKVVDELTAAGMFQPEAPAPWRYRELEWLQQACHIMQTFVDLPKEVLEAEEREAAAQKEAQKS